MLSFGPNLAPLPVRVARPVRRRCARLHFRPASAWLDTRPDGNPLSHKTAQPEPDRLRRRPAPEPRDNGSCLSCLLSALRNDYFADGARSGCFPALSASFGFTVLVFTTFLLSQRLPAALAAGSRPFKRALHPVASQPKSRRQTHPCRLAPFQVRIAPLPVRPFPAFTSTLAASCSRPAGSPS